MIPFWSYERFDPYASFTLHYFRYFFSKYTTSHARVYLCVCVSRKKTAKNHNNCLLNDYSKRILLKIPSDKYEPVWNSGHSNTHTHFYADVELYTRVQVAENVLHNGRTARTRVYRANNITINICFVPFER